MVRHGAMVSFICFDLIVQAATTEDQSLYTSSISSESFYLFKNLTMEGSQSQLECDIKLQFPCWSKCGKQYQIKWIK